MQPEGASAKDGRRKDVAEGAEKLVPTEDGSYELFRALIATAVDGIIVIDARGTVRIYNGACERLFGYAEEDVLGQNVKMLMPDPYRIEHDGYLANYLNTGERRIIGIGREVTGRRRDGTTFPMYLSVGEGELASAKIFVGIIHDLTERHLADDALREREARLRSILDTVPDAIVTIDERGLIESFSPAASRLFGYSADEVIGRNVNTLMPSPYRENHDRYLSNYRTTGVRRIIGLGRVVVGRRRDGSTFPMELSVGEVFANDRRIFTGFVRDITERQGTERRLQELQSELLHVSRLSAMGHMSSALAHELNQPLTAISNYVKAAKRTMATEGFSVARVTEYIDSAGEEVLRAGAIIRNLRDFTEKRESNRAPADINTVVEEAIALGFVGAADANVRVQVELDPTIPPVMIDKVQIQQVLINLIRNAVEAMMAVERRELNLSTQLLDDSVEIVVTDTGPGLSEDVLARLFQPFVTTKETGIGIGLTICQSIIEAHGGQIGALKDRPVGAGFAFRLPLAEKRGEE